MWITAVYNRFNLLMENLKILVILKSKRCSGQVLTIWITSEELNKSNQNWFSQNINNYQNMLTVEAYLE